MLVKLNCFCFSSLIKLVLLMWKWMVLFLKKNHLLWCWGESSLLNWIGLLTFSVAKTASKKIGALIRSIKFLSPEVPLYYLYKSTIWSCMEYYCHVLAGAPCCYLELCWYLVDVHLDWLNWFHFLILEEGLLVILIVFMSFVSLDVTRITVSTFSFLAQLDSGILYLKNPFLWSMI